MKSKKLFSISKFLICLELIYSCIFIVYYLVAGTISNYLHSIMTSVPSLLEYILIFSFVFFKSKRQKNSKVLFAAFLFLGIMFSLSALGSAFILFATENNLTSIKDSENRLFLTIIFFILAFSYIALTMMVKNGFKSKVFKQFVFMLIISAYILLLISDLQKISEFNSINDTIVKVLQDVIDVLYYLGLWIFVNNFNFVPLKEVNITSKDNNSETTNDIEQKLIDLNAKFREGNIKEEEYQKTKSEILKNL